VPLDRLGRTNVECREHAAQVAGLMDDLRNLVARIAAAGVGRERESGSKFDRRWNTQLVAMQRVVDRDERHAKWLDDAIAQEAERRRQSG
jgi:hypothetical protein